MRFFSVCSLVAVLAPHEIQSFSPNHLLATTTSTKQQPHPRNHHQSSYLSAGRGFGSDAQDREPLVDNKTYGKEAVSPRNDLIDTESAMREFFEGAAADWKPLFRSMISKSGGSSGRGSSPAAMSWLKDVDVSNFEFEETSTTPWRRLGAIPTEDSDREVLAMFLDSVQASLVDIPVDERTKDDENDLHFLEEGRRVLVCSRFHVVTGVTAESTDRIEGFDRLFAACWNELYHLQDMDEIDTGSLIVVPGSNVDDMRRFVDMNLQRPLQILGLDSSFEVASMERGSPAIRLIHKLSGIPEVEEEEPIRLGDLVGDDADDE